MIGLVDRMWRRALVLTPLILLPLTAVPAAAQDKIVLDGATGVLPLARALVAGYQQRWPDARIEVGNGLGTGERLQALAAGQIQIAVASHGITPDAVRLGNLTVLTVAKGAVVFAVNRTIPLSSIAERHVCGVYGGEITTWSALGGGESPITVLTRPPEEVDSEVIRAKLACFTNLTETPHALGMTSMTVVAQSEGRVKALALDSIAPTTENVQPTGSVRKFLDFVRGPDGDQVILANGAVPAR